MNSLGWTIRCGLLGMLLLWPHLVLAADPLPEGLPRAKDLQTPSAEDLLRKPPMDWLILYNDDVLIVSPVQPRPLKIKDLMDQIAAKELERARVVGEARERMTRELEEVSLITVILPEGDDRREFKLSVKYLKQVVHHEDLMLRRIDTLLNENNLPVAFELLSRLQRDRPDWEGVAAAGQKFLDLDAQAHASAGDPEVALRILDELFVRNVKYPDLQARYDAVAEQLVQKAISQQDFIRAQFHLNELQRHFANDPVFRKYETQLTDQSRATMQSAVEKGRQNDVRQAAVLAEEAVRIWPRTPELKALHKPIAERFQRLHVGVTDLPGECRAYPMPSDADIRRQQLTMPALFEVDRLRDGTAYYRTRFFDEWEPRDLGRRMQFTLRQFRQPFEMQATLTSDAVVAALMKRLDPTSPDYDERLGSFVESVSIDSPTQFSLIFRRVPPRIEPLLARIPLTDAGGFRVLEQTQQQICYTRSIPEPAGLPRYHIGEIIEHRYSSAEKIVQGLQRGEVSVTFGLPDVVLRRLQSNDEFLRKFFIQPMQQPVTHLLQFNPGSAPLRIMELRKGLAYAVDRERLLKDVVLRDQRPTHGRLVTTPFFSTNPGRNVLVEQRRFDLSAGLALVLAARHQLQGTIPPLTMVVAPGLVAEEAAEEIALQWRRIGLTVKVVHADEPPPEKWDILYRTLQMNEPVLDLWPFLTFEPQARISALDAYPDWLKQELVQLDRSGNQTLVVGAIRGLHRHLADETAFVPLWEIDQFLVLRKNIQGFPQNPVQCYDDVDHWTMEAWYQGELP
ncbi:ABC transporter substrate-binding protein [Planctomicrobium piriforme]|uniref:ABC-type transport system, substrate-binding protein n=1 Tax=Planctomicrobium piriforme TaxID=1576369 RepID=A0A1I3CCR3_9PLAN|nr:ABC transporter substrate-binding protein [Planctomicrobium piriforme]SFH72086.1 ABC-type transport system, substrate-binding protein [Planctomicrobium piriforme]